MAIDKCGKILIVDDNEDVRILAATNANLCKKVSEGEFRQDLFYRLNTIELHLPPLRERGEDIILLAEHFRLETSSTASASSLTIGGMENVESLNLQTLEREAIKRAISLSNGNLTQE